MKYPNKNPNIIIPKVKNKLNLKTFFVKTRFVSNKKNKLIKIDKYLDTVLDKRAETLEANRTEILLLCQKDILSYKLYRLKLFYVYDKQPYVK